MKLAPWERSAERDWPNLFLRRLYYYGMGDGRCPTPVRAMSKAGFLSGLVWTSPLARGHRGRALARWYAWQVWRRVVGRPVELKLPTGAWLRCPPESRIAGLLLATGSHEPADLTFVARVVAPGDLIVDVGANIGLYSLTAAGLGAKVAAIEPSAQARHHIEVSLSRSALRSSTAIYPIALADVPGRERFTTDLDVKNHLTDESLDDRAEWVEVDTLDRLVSANPDFFDRPIKMLKIDAEGSDERVLRGGTQVLSRHKPIVIVETWNGGRSIRTLLAEFGYQAWRYSLASRALRPVPASWDGEANLVFIADNSLESVNRQLGQIPLLPSGSLPPLHWWPK